MQFIFLYYVSVMTFLPFDENTLCCSVFGQCCVSCLWRSPSLISLTVSFCNAFMIKFMSQLVGSFNSQIRLCLSMLRQCNMKLCTRIIQFVQIRVNSKTFYGLRLQQKIINRNSKGYLYRNVLSVTHSLFGTNIKYFWQKSRNED